MKQHTYEKLGETLFTHVAENGLTIKVIRKPGFTRKMAYFVTDFGSVHTDFEWEETIYHAPAGIAHFLEHKMFELLGRDVSAEFAALGANVNAFTTYDMTAYYFSCSDHFTESLKLLLEFVSTPYFPYESVEREMGIIDQEIGMNEDAPETCVFENLMQILYKEHPIRVPILGTRESLRRITPELLTACHRAFYTPANMILCVIGDVEPEEIVSLAEQMLGKERKPVGKKLRPWNEEMKVEKPLRKEIMEVAMPMFQTAFKCEPVVKGRTAMEAEIIGDLAAEALFGESSALYLELYEKGLIDASFGGGFEAVDGSAMFTCAGDSEQGEAVVAAILNQAKRLVANGIPEEDFLRMKRSSIGRRMRELDSFDNTRFRLCAYHFEGFEYFEFPEVYATVTADQVLDFIARVVTEARCSLSIIHPKEEIQYE